MERASTQAVSHKVVLRIVDNYLEYTTSAWDIQWIGRNRLVREASRQFLLDIDWAPPTVEGIKRDALKEGEGEGTFVALVAVPAAVVTETGPVVASVGTFAFKTLVADLSTNPVTVAPLNSTMAAAVKFEPMITTGVPAG